MANTTAAVGSEADLWLAVRRGDLFAAAFLMDNGLDVNLINPQDGGSFLHSACKSNNYAMVSLLLSRGADKFLKNKSGQIPKDLTTSAEVVTLLQGSLSCAASPYRSFNNRDVNDLPHNMIIRNDLQNHTQSPDILLKVRISNSSDLDFIEIELPNSSCTYQNLLNICCQELEINPEMVNRIRKLPDTRIRSDADVRRLQAMQELEIVLKENLTPGTPVSANIYPSISANKNQTVLY